MPLHLLATQRRPFLFFQRQCVEDFVNYGGLSLCRADSVPAPGPQFAQASLNYDVYDNDEYRKPTSEPSGTVRWVVQASRMLYTLNPDIPSDCSPETAVGLQLNSTKLSLGFVAHTLLHASEYIQSAVPIRLVSRTEPVLDTEYWGIVLGILKGTTTVYSVLPVQLELHGSTNVKSHPWKGNFASEIAEMNWFMDDNIVEKIDGLPVLRCNDVELFFEGGYSSDPYTVWITRRYQTCWQLSAHGPPIAMRSNYNNTDSSIRRNPNNVRRVFSSLTVSESVNLDMFSDISVLAETIVKYASLHHVSFTNGPPTMPFTNLEISAFELLCHEYCPRELISLSCPTSILVNKQESCAFHTFCTELPEAASEFCTEHRIITARFYSSLSTANRNFFAGIKLPRKENYNYDAWKQTDLQPVVTRRPDDTTLLSTITNLHWLYEQKTVWVIDVEFASLHAAQPVPFTLVARDSKTEAIVAQLLRIIIECVCLIFNSFRVTG